ncbi:MAG: hypothetical protein JWQ52_1639, partial [Phenylobacterium sp.]|nr:hypothetical protein [Phenylobacterium sp.]
PALRRGPMITVVEAKPRAAALHSSGIAEIMGGRDKPRT